ncbi:MAG: hypothetical protein GY716_12130 [bacterium]|nr:hypothetical protein [bacterium]
MKAEKPAVTEAELLGAQAGALLGGVYALLWYAVADRAAGQGRRPSATWHGLAATVIAYPLVWESSVKFGFLGPTASVACLGVITAAAIGLGSGITIARELPAGWIALGIASAGIGLAGYAVSFTLIDRAEGRTNFIVYSSLALVFVMLAVVELLPVPVLAVFLALGALAMAWIGARRGLRGRRGDRLLCVSIAVHGRTWGRLSEAPKLVVLVIATLGLGGLVVSLVAPLLPGDLRPDALAVLRTAVVAVTAVALAWLGRMPRLVQDLVAGLRGADRGRVVDLPGLLRTLLRTS